MTKKIDRTCEAHGPEWGFQEAPEMVDMTRLWEELLALPAIFAYSYLDQLRTKAPRTYSRLRDIRVANGCNVFAWTKARDLTEQEVD
jgi:hypothetical protein